MGSLLGLGVSGGLVPCPSALILLLSAISLGQVAVGLALLGAFSAGLAVVLMSIGGLVIYGKHLLPKNRLAADHPLVRLLPVFSSVVVIVVGLLMTLTAAGLIQPVKLLT
jgi:nickel/cobalt exporter